MSKFKVGDEFIYEGVVGKITYIVENSRDEEYGFYGKKVYRWKHVGGKKPLTRLRKFVENSKKHIDSLPLTRLSKLLYDI